MKAKKKPVASEDLSSISLSPVRSEASATSSKVLSVDVRPERVAGLKIVDEGDAGVKLADYLVLNRLI
jgi:electron transfer flavoprotein beta subunit